MSTTKVVIGIDAGGSTTRAVCADLSGAVLAYAETGGANPSHNTDAKENVQAAIRRVIEQAERQLEDVVALVAGIAGLDVPDDHVWATEHTAVPGLACPRIQVNDAEVAHAGAFGTGPGIIAIVAEIEQVRDFIVLHYVLSARDDTPFWRQIASIVPPDSLLSRMEGYVRTGRVKPAPGELFTDLSWFYVFEGMGVRPQAYDPLMDVVRPEQLRAMLERLSAETAAAVSRAPTHDSALPRPPARAPLHVSSH